MSRPQFVLIAGPNGAGKSTFTKMIRRHIEGVEVIDPDAIAKEITGSFSTIDQEQLSAGKKAISRVRFNIQNGHPFLVESTISGLSYLRYCQQAENAGFRTAFIYIGLSSPELSAERVRERVGTGGHNIPLVDIRRRYPKSLDNLKQHIKAFESAHIYDNSSNYSWVASYRSGSIHRISKDIPSWIQGYLP